MVDRLVNQLVSHIVDKQLGQLLDQLVDRLAEKFIFSDDHPSAQTARKHSEWQQMKPLGTVAYAFPFRSQKTAHHQQHNGKIG